MASQHLGPGQPESSRAGVRQAVPGARIALALLLLINLFNYVDRYILAAVEPDIRETLLLSADPEDANVKAKMGLLSTAFMVTYMITAPVFGWLAERVSRWLSIAVGVALWSLASGASGLASACARLEAWLAVEESSPSHNVGKAEEVVRVAEALQGLPDVQRQAVVLYYWQACTLEEIGKELGRSGAAAAGLLRRGLEKMRHLITHRGSGPPANISD